MCGIIFVEASQLEDRVGSATPTVSGLPAGFGFPGGALRILTKHS